jgi:hypothetical protein
VVVGEWAKNHALKNQKDLREVEKGVKYMFENNEEGIFSEEEYQSLKELEGKKKVLLNKENVEWTLKSKAIWLIEGDNNKKKIHKYANYRRKINTIWEISKLDVSRAKSFKEIAEVGKQHFRNLFKDLENANIEE